MDFYPLVVLAPIGGVAACLLAHITINWLTRGRRLLVGFIGGLIVGWTVQLLITIGALVKMQSGWPDGVALAVVNQFTFLALTDCYMHSINILICSLRVRVLQELLEADDGLSEKHILANYSARDLVAMRLVRLRSSGQVHYENGRYYSRRSAMLLLGKFYRLLKILLLGKSAAERPSR